MEKYTIMIPERIIKAAEDHKKEMLKEWENSEKYEFLKSLDLEFYISDYINKYCR